MTTNSNIAAPAEGPVYQETSMSKKEPFNPALDAPIALTPDQIEQVAGGSASRISVLNGDLGSVLGGATTGLIAPPPELTISYKSLTASS